MAMRIRLWSNLSLTGVLQECEKTHVVSCSSAGQGRSRAAFLSMFASHTVFRAFPDSLQGCTERFRCRTACREPLRLPSAPAHYLAMRQKFTKPCTLFTAKQSYRASPPGAFHSRLNKNARTLRHNARPHQAPTIKARMRSPFSSPSPCPSFFHPHLVLGRCGGRAGCRPLSEFP